MKGPLITLPAAQQIHWAQKKRRSYAGGAEFSLPCHSRLSEKKRKVTNHVMKNRTQGNGTKLSQQGLGCVSGKDSSHRGCFGTGTDSPGKWSLHQSWRSIWTVLSGTWWEFWKCRARSRTQWSFWVSSNSADSVVLWTRQPEQ